MNEREIAGYKVTQAMSFALSDDAEIVIPCDASYYKHIPFASIERDLKKEGWELTGITVNVEMKDGIPNINLRASITSWKF